MRRPLIGAKGFRSFHWTRETSSRMVMEAHQERGYYVYVGRKEGVFCSYVWRGAHGKCVCKD
jgi:hypothetical protein